MANPHKDVIWIDHKGRRLQLVTLSDKYLKRIKNYLLKNNPEIYTIEIIRLELKRRKDKNLPK